MKKIIKTATAVALCAAMCVSLGACGEKKNANNGTTTVTIWSGNGHDKAFLNERIAKWNETTGKEKGVRIEYTVQEGNINEKLSLAFETDQAPDLFTGGNFMEYVEKGYIAPFDDIEGIDGIMNHYSKYTAYGRTKYYDGKIYSIPNGAGTYGLIYNKDMFKAAGIVDEKGEPTPPETLDELRDYAKRLTNESKKEYGIIFPGKFGSWYGDDVMKMASASCGFVDGYNPKTGEYDFSAQGAVMKTLVGIKEDGSCYPGVEGLDNDPARARFAAGGVAMKTAGSYDYGVLTDQFPATIDWGVAPFPVIDKNDKHKQYMGVGAYLLINKKSVPEKEKAIAEVLNFFYSDELIIDAYKNGINLPIDWDLVKDVELDDSMKQWKQFAELVSISIDCPVSIKTGLKSGDAMAVKWINEIWPGNIPSSQIDSFCEEMTKKYNDAAANYQKENPDYDPSTSIIPEWDSAR